VTKEKQLEFGFVEKIDKDYHDKCNKEIGEEACEQFTQLMKRYAVKPDDIKAIYHYARWF